MAFEPIGIADAAGEIVYLVVTTYDDPVQVFDFDDNTFKLLSVPAVTPFQLLSEQADECGQDMSGYETQLDLSLLNQTNLEKRLKIGCFRQLGDAPDMLTDLWLNESQQEIRVVCGVNADKADALFIADEVNDALPTTTNFHGSNNLSTIDDYYKGAIIVFTQGGSGTLAAVARKCSSYSGASRNFEFLGATGAADAAFPAIPVDHDPYLILGRIG